MSASELSQVFTPVKTFGHKMRSPLIEASITFLHVGLLGKLSQHETFYPRHDNWLDRAARPYVLFEKPLTDFNINDPLHVATYRGGLAGEVASRLASRPASASPSLIG